MPPNENQDIIDFLRKLASMLTGGRNAVMLLEAAQAIEAQAERAIAVELLHQERQADHAKNLELREQAQLLSDRLMIEVTALKAQLAESERQAVTEVTALKAQLTESERRTENERTFFAEEVRHLQARLEDANAQLAEANAELDELRKPVTVIDHSIAIVPVDSLQLARTQFDFLAAGFARNGDVISQTICQIGACAIDKALSGNEVAEN